jgi:hypothetical protein
MSKSERVTLCQSSLKVAMIFQKGTSIMEDIWFLLISKNKRQYLERLINHNTVQALTEWVHLANKHKVFLKD